MTLKNALGDIALDAHLTDGTQKSRIVDAAGDTAGVTAGGLLQVDASGATVPVSGPLTDTQLRASAVPVSGTVTITDGSGPVTVDGTVGVTGYPTAAAAADAYSNPTITHVGADNMQYNGATWDRVRSPSLTANVDASSARTASGTGGAFTNHMGAHNLWVWINVTVVSGTTPTCVFRLQWSPDNGTTWLDWDTTNLQTTSITGVTTAQLRVGINIATAANAGRADVVPRQVRLAWTIGGTTPSFTFASWFTATQ